LHACIIKLFKENDYFSANHVTLGVLCYFYKMLLYYYVLSTATVDTLSSLFFEVLVALKRAV